MKPINWKFWLVFLVGAPIVWSVSQYIAERDASKHFRIDRSQAGGAPIVTASLAPDVTAFVTEQEAGGVTQDQMDMAFLRNLEGWLVERVKVNVSKSLVANGLPADEPEVVAQSSYVQSDGHKFAVIRMTINGAVSQAVVVGVVGGSFKRVTCLHESAENVPITYGVCAEKIKEAFGVGVAG